VDNVDSKLNDVLQKKNRFLTVITLSTDSVDSLWIEREFPVNHHLITAFPHYVGKVVENLE
jgi:hypothetical protein